MPSGNLKVQCGVTIYKFVGWCGEQVLTTMVGWAQMHNADQLVEWCLTCMATNYNHVCHKHTKQLRALHPENQAYLNRHRWPPVW